MTNKIRKLHTLTSGVQTTDGDGVKITRFIGTPDLNMLDPFLLLDVVESDQSKDYIGGFPDHPHRGFETVTYLLAGRIRHKDNAAHEGVIEPGGLQWMTAGKGIIHSEMPEQKDGLLQGLQLWINLPAREKMQAPAYQEFAASEIAVEHLDNGAEIRVIAGSTDNGTVGPVMNDYVNPVYLDISLPKGQVFKQTVGTEDNVFIFVIDGAVTTGDSKLQIGHRQLGILRDGEQIVVAAEEQTRFLLLAAHQLNEPVARGGPFVMNTKQEVLQAFDDYQNHRF